MIIVISGNMNSLEWNGRMERWSGLLEWSTGLDYWRGVASSYACTNVHRGGTGIGSFGEPRVVTEGVFC